MITVCPACIPYSGIDPEPRAGHGCRVSTKSNIRFATVTSVANGSIAYPRSRRRDVERSHATSLEIGAMNPRAGGSLSRLGSGELLTLLHTSGWSRVDDSRQASN